MKPKLQGLVKDVELVPNMTFVLTCNPLSGSKPFVFTWTKDGQKLHNSNDLKIESLESVSLLTIHQLRPNDSGLFQCSATNAFGVDSTSTTLIVKGFYLFFSFLFFDILSMLTLRSSRNVAHYSLKNSLKKNGIFHFVKVETISFHQCFTMSIVYYILCLTISYSVLAGICT